MTETGSTYVTVSMVGRDPARSSELYSLAFGMEKIHGPTKFFGDGVIFYSSEAALDNGCITYNFYAPHDGPAGVHIWSFVPVVSRDLEASMNAAVEAGFEKRREVGIDDKVMPGLRHGLLSDPDENLVVVLAEDDLKRVLVSSAPSEV